MYIRVSQCLRDTVDIQSLNGIRKPKMGTISVWLVIKSYTNSYAGLFVSENFKFPTLPVIKYMFR